MAANRHLRLALSTLSHCQPLARPRLHPLRPACQCRSIQVRARKGGVQVQHQEIKRFKVDAMLDFTDLQPAVVEAFIQRQRHEFDLRSPAEYYEGLMAYADEIRSRKTPYPVFKPTEKLPNAAVLHDLGCIVLEVSRGRMTLLASSLWFVASNWGYAPSTCSLISSMARHGAYGTLDFLAPAERRFQALLNSGRDMIALAIHGEILRSQGNLAAAEDALREALRRHEAKGGGELGNWEPNARIALGQTLAQRGKTDEAVAMLRRLSDEGYIEADVPLGKALRGTDADQAAQYMYRAGCAGALEVFNEIAALELDKSAKADTPSEAEDHRKWAQELTHLANRKAEF
ncbi:hypothetical protein PWT90_08454 [Aphanocladium album]|nr:hypothetical protein PWT90_08454 [Aphanocladium album]